MKTWAGKMPVYAGVFAVMMPLAAANAQELSEKAINSFMEYAWSLTPQQFSKPDGTTIIIDKKKRDEVVVPVEEAREVIKAGRLSAHAQVCDLKEDQVENHHALMRRESAKKWTQQQLVYINQLHLTTVMLLTGKIRLIEKDGDKEVVVDEGKAPATSCTAEQKTKIAELIKDYVAKSPVPVAKSPAAAAAAVASEGKAAAAPAAQPASATAPAATGSTTPAAAPAPAAGAAPEAKAPAAQPAAQSAAQPAAAAPKAK